MYQRKLAEIVKENTTVFKDNGGKLETTEMKAGLYCSGRPADYLQTPPRS